MNAKLQGLFLAFVLLASMFSHSESFFPNRVGRKRSFTQESEGYEALPLGTRNLRLAREGSDELRLRKDELCEFAKRTCR